MHDIVREERRALGLYAAAGKQRLAELQAEQLAGQGSEDPSSASARARSTMRSG